MTTKSLKDQIEAAFDYRGHVTLRLTDGSSVEGYMYSRDFGLGVIDLMVKNSEERRRLEISKLASVELSGEDCAAGKSYEDLQKKKAAEKGSFEAGR